MGLKDWLKGGQGEPVPPMKIQDLERIMLKRKDDTTGSVVLLIGGDEYRLIRVHDYDRIVRAVEAVEALAKRLKD